jgi:hypothetical protein
MWLFTDTGFVSAVNHRENEGYLMVRARDRVSLQPLADICELEIKFTPYADYPYRVVVSKPDFASWVSDSIDFLGYSNFKNQVAVTRGKDFAHTLGSVWSTMHDVEDEEARNRYQSYDLDNEYMDA